MYPDNEAIRNGVELGIRRIKGGYISFAGSLADRYEQHLAEVEQVLEDEEIPELARPTLERFATWLRDEAKKERIAEADEEVNL
jgi:hypothetical protein